MRGEERWQPGWTPNDRDSSRWASHYVTVVGPFWEAHLVSLSCRRLVEISAVTSLSGTLSLSHVTLAVGKEVISALNSQTSSSSADSYSPNFGWMDMNSLAVNHRQEVGVFGMTSGGSHRKQTRAKRTVNANGDLLGLTHVGYYIGDGTGVNARVLDRSLWDCEGVKNLLILFVLVNRLNSTISL